MWETQNVATSLSSKTSKNMFLDHLNVFRVSFKRPHSSLLVALNASHLHRATSLSSKTSENVFLRTFKHFKGHKLPSNPPCCHPHLTHPQNSLKTRYLLFSARFKAFWTSKPFSLLSKKQLYVQTHTHACGCGLVVICLLLLL